MGDEEIIIGALKRELRRARKITEKARAEMDEAMSVSAELRCIYSEFEVLRNSDISQEQRLSAIAALCKREKHAHRVMKKDFVKLCEVFFAAEAESNAVATALNNILTIREVRAVCRQANHKKE